MLNQGNDIYSLPLFTSLEKPIRQHYGESKIIPRYLNRKYWQISRGVIVKICYHGNIREELSPDWYLMIININRF